jgi:hypothetical protein
MASSNKLTQPVVEKPKKPGQVTTSIKDLANEVDKTENFVDQLEVLLRPILSVAPMAPAEADVKKNESVELAIGIDVLRDRQFMINRKLVNILERIEL